MKKTTLKKMFAAILSLSMILTLALSATGVFGATAGTDITIHKLGMTSFEGYPVANPNGAPLDLEDMDGVIGELAGVQFNYYRVDGSAMYDFGAITDAALAAVSEATLAADPDVDFMGSFITTATGYTIPDLADGRYVFYEEAENGLIVDDLAVPFVLNLPTASRDAQGNVMYDQAGNVIYLSAIHVYPKNMTEEPMPMKHVRALEDTIDSGTMGENLLFILTSTLPATIDEYDQFDFVDVLDTRLDYTGNLEVMLDGVALTGSTVAALPVGYFASETYDYFAIVPTTTGGGTLNIHFTQRGLDALAASDLEEYSLQVHFTVTINETAASDYTPADGDDEIPNDFTIYYKNTYTAPDVPGPVKDEDSNTVYVYCGGKTFIKTNDFNLPDTTGNIRYLGGAQFALYRDINGTGIGGTAVLWTQNLIDELAPTAATFVDAGTAGYLGDPIVFISGADGKFEVRGLKALTTEPGIFDGKYYLEETVAPAGYIKLNVPITFTVTRDGYDITAPQQIKNAEMPNLPMTGGIGTIIFLAGGLVLMGGAVVALRRRQHAQG